MSFSFAIMLDSLGIAVRYIGTTLFMAIASLLVGLIFGIIIALIRNYQVKFISPFLQAVVTILKGVPTVLVILGIYLLMSRMFNDLMDSFGWSTQFRDVNPIWIAIFALSLMSTINVSEIFRGTFSSIKKGQYDAAKSIGLTTPQTIRRVLLPQAFPVALPMMSSLLISLVKASSLASMVSVVDVFAAARISAQQNYRFLEAYIAVAIIYWMISLVIEKSSGLLERKLNQRMRGSLS